MRGSKNILIFAAGFLVACCLLAVIGGTGYYFLAPMEEPTPMVIVATLSPTPGPPGDTEEPSPTPQPGPEDSAEEPPSTPESGPEDDADQPPPTPEPGPEDDAELPSPTPQPEPQAAYVAPTSLDLPLSVANRLGVDRASEPVTAGLPVPASVNLTELSTLRLLDGDGQPIAAQFTPLARWGGAPEDASGPVRWLLLDFQADVAADAAASYRLVDSGGGEGNYPTLELTDGPDAVNVDTGAAQFSINKADGSLMAPQLTAPLVGRAVDAVGQEYTTSGPVSIEVAMSGPMRVSIHVRGAYRADSGQLLDYTSRYWFYAGQPFVRLFHTVENNTLCPLGEYEQLACFDIGSGGSVSVADLSLVLPAAPGGNPQFRAGVQEAVVESELTAPLLLYQDSSGTDHWDHYATLTDWDGNPLDGRPRMQSYVSFRGYQLTLDGTDVDSGDYAAGWLGVSGEAGAWGAGVRDFWQNFPKALRAAPDGTLEIGLFPDEFGPADYAFTLRAGEHKTHEIMLTADDRDLGALLSPLFAQATADWYVHSGGFGLTALPNATDWPEHEDYIRYQLDTAPSYEDWMDWFPNLPAAIESTDFYGMFDYGDWPIDYEGYGIAPLNPKYDNDYGMWLQWARGGDSRWFDLAQAAGRHVADVDILHNLHDPRHWGDGIIFGHSAHDEDGLTNPHRNINSGNPDTAWGEGGLLLSYYLTGYEKAHESALELADCIAFRQHNEVQLCEFFADGECDGTGYALMEGLYGGGGRLAANSLFIVVEAYRATADPRYLAAADALVSWARPGNQPFINGPTGKDEQMRPWMLNMYLRALADYLEVRREFGLPDTYEAEASYLAYVDWLHSYPWIDLEPIETGPRAAYPYEWWFDDRAGIAGEDNDNQDPAINNWLLLGADAMAYAYRLSGDAFYLDRGTMLFRAGSRDPWYPGDENTYAQSKETANSIAFGHIFLHEWQAAQAQ